MGLIALPQRFYSQPQYVAPVDKRVNGLVSALVFDNQGSIVDRVTGVRYPVTNAVVRTDRSGNVLYFDGTGDYVNTGTRTLGGVNLFADSTSQWSAVVCGKLEASGSSGTFIAKCGATGGSRTFHVFRDPGFATKDPSIFLRGTENALDWNWNTDDWHQYTVTWDGSTAMAYGDADKSSALSVGSAAQETENILFGARTGSSPAFPLTGRIAYGYFFNRAISRQESIELFQNPWRIFQAPSRRVYVASSIGSQDITGAGQIATAEALGSPAVGAAIVAAGVITAESIGSTQVSAGVTNSGIASTEAFGSVALAVVVETAGIASEESLGAPAVGGVTPAEITGVGQIATAEASGSPAIALAIETTGVQSAETLGSTALSAGIAAASITSAEALGSPEVGGVAPVDITGVGQIPTAEAMGSPIVNVAIAAAGVTSAEAFGTASLATQITNAGGIATTEAVGAPAVTEAGPATITGVGGISSAEAFGAVSIYPMVPYTGTGFQIGSGRHRPPRNRGINRIESVSVAHSIGTVGIESQERLGYPQLNWRGRSRKVRDEEFLLCRAA